MPVPYFLACSHVHLDHPHRRAGEPAAERAQLHDPDEESRWVRCESDFEFWKTLNLKPLISKRGAFQKRCEWIRTVSDSHSDFETRCSGRVGDGDGAEMVFRALQRKHTGVGGKEYMKLVRILSRLGRFDDALTYLDEMCKVGASWWRCWWCWLSCCWWWSWLLSWWGWCWLLVLVVAVLLLVV